MIPKRLSEDLREEYDRLYAVCYPAPEHFKRVEDAAIDIGRRSFAYKVVEQSTGIPWQWIGVLHYVHCGQNFNCHFHNADPLDDRTVNDPTGRPSSPEPPYSWAQSAYDALAMRGVLRIFDWSIPSMLYQFERWEGFRYRDHGIHSPFLWAGSQHYTRGRFESDGAFDHKARYMREGAAVILKRLLQLAPLEHE